MEFSGNESLAGREDRTGISIIDMNIKESLLIRQKDNI